MLLLAHCASVVTQDRLHQGKRKQVLSALVRTVFL